MHPFWPDGKICFLLVSLFGHLLMIKKLLSSRYDLTLHQYYTLNWMLHRNFLRLLHLVAARSGAEPATGANLLTTAI